MSTVGFGTPVRQMVSVSRVPLLGAPSPTQIDFKAIDEPADVFKEAIESKVQAIFLGISCRNPFKTYERKIYTFDLSSAASDEFQVSLVFKPKTDSFFAFKMGDYTSKIYSTVTKESGAVTNTVHETLFSKVTNPDSKVFKTLSGVASVVCHDLTENDVKSLIQEAHPEYDESYFTSAETKEYIKQQTHTLAPQLLKIESLNIKYYV